MGYMDYLIINGMFSFWDYTGFIWMASRNICLTSTFQGHNLCISINYNLDYSLLRQSLH